MQPSGLSAGLVPPLQDNPVMGGAPPSYNKCNSTFKKYNFNFRIHTFNSKHNPPPEALKQVHKEDILQNRYNYHVYL